MSNKKYVTYEEFGAKGDGVTDDFFAIKAAHEYANENHMPVRAKDDATYYINRPIVDGEIKEIIKEVNKFCKKCGKHTIHKITF